jgi:hypothetical protein
MPITDGVSVVVPTYNEAANIPQLAERLASVRAELRVAGRDLDVWLMDDRGGDNTPEVVAKLGMPWLHLVERTGQRGLGNAVMDGFAHATQPIVVVMDADLSHPPEAIPKLLAALDQGADMAFGSRYVPGASIDAGWSMLRRLNSLGATWLARPFVKMSDPMSGFFAVRRDRVRDAAGIEALGYKIGLEIAVKARAARIDEIPIHFADRTAGESKLSFRTQLQYLSHLWRLARWRWPALGWIPGFLIAWAILLAIALAAWGFRPERELTICYMPAADRYLARESVFTPNPGDRGNWVYPPAMILSVAALPLVRDTLGEWAMRVAWCMALTGAVVASAWLIAQALLPPTIAPARRKAVIAALIVAGLVTQTHLRAPLGYLSHDPLILLGLAVGFAAGAARREALAGIGFGVAAALKVVPGLFLPILLLQRRWKAAGAMVVAGALLTIVPDLVRPPRDAPFQAVEFATIAAGAGDVGSAGGGRWAPWNVQAQNAAAILYRLTVPTPATSETDLGGDWSLAHLSDGARRPLTLALLGAIFAATCFVAWRSERRVRALTLDEGLDANIAPYRLLDVGAVACAMLLLAPHASKYHFAVTIFAATACFLAAFTKPRSIPVVLCAAALVILGLPTGRDLIGDRATDLLLMYGSVGGFALVGLVACVVLASARPRAARMKD